MAGKSHLDELIDYKEKIISMISNSQEVLALISNDPDIVVGSDAALKIIDENIFDYNYVDGTQVISNAIIMIDTDMVRRPSPTVKDMGIYVQVVVNKEYMKLKGCGFTGLKGNRRDNIVRYVDLLLSNSREFGIGRLDTESAITSVVPDKYTSKLITYAVPDFARNRSLGNV